MTKITTLDKTREDLNETIVPRAQQKKTTGENQRGDNLTPL